MMMGLGRLVARRGKAPGFVAALKFNIARASQYIAMIFKGGL